MKIDSFNLERRQNYVKKSYQTKSNYYIFTKKSSRNVNITTYYDFVARLVY